MKRLIFVMYLAAALLAACGGGATTETDADATLAPVPAEYTGMTNPLGKDAAAQGAELFQTNCATCHGQEGHGDGPAGQSLEPRPKNLAEIQSKAGDDFLFWRIHDGVPGTSMVAWNGILSDEQIWQIVSFLRTLN